MKALSSLFSSSNFPDADLTWQPLKKSHWFSSLNPSSTANMFFVHWHHRRFHRNQVRICGLAFSGLRQFGFPVLCVDSIIKAAVLLYLYLYNKDKKESPKGHRVCVRACEGERAEEGEGLRSRQTHHLPGLLCWSQSRLQLPVSSEFGVLIYCFRQSFQLIFSRMFLPSTSLSAESPLRMQTKTYSD